MVCIQPKFGGVGVVVFAQYAQEHEVTQVDVARHVGQDGKVDVAVADAGVAKPLSGRPRPDRVDQPMSSKKMIQHKRIIFS